MPVRDEAGLPLDLQGQILHELLVELDDGATLLAAGVVVHTLGRQLVARITLAEVILAHDAQLGKKVQRPVHRGEAEIRMFALYPVVDLLGREMPLPLQLAHDDATLVGEPVTPVLEYPLELDHGDSLVSPFTSIKN